MPTFLKALLDNRLSWSKHIFHVRKNFMQKVDVLKRMKYLFVKTLENYVRHSDLGKVLHDSTFSLEDQCIREQRQLFTTLSHPYLMLNVRFHF